jgi:hypothetical protein
MAAPKMPRAVRATTDEIGAGRYPKALLLACASWALLAVVLFVSRIGVPAPTDAEETDAATGVTAVRPPDVIQGWWVPYLPWLGVLVLILAVVLFFGVGWARLALALLGLIAVVGLAASSVTAFFAIPAIVLFVVGCVASVLVSTHRYLTQPRTGGESADPASSRVVS